MWYIKGEQHEVRTSSGICDCSGKLNEPKLIFDHYDIIWRFPKFQKNENEI